MTSSIVGELTTEEYRPYVTLHPDGTFEFQVNLLEAISIVDGTYAIVKNILRLQVVEPVPTGFTGDDIEVFEFEIAGDNLIYLNTTFVGVTSAGDEFILQ